MCGVRARVDRCGCMLGGGGRRRAGPGRRAARTSFALFSISFSISFRSQFLLPCPRKPIKQHNGCFYWLTRDIAVSLARLRPPGREKAQSSTLVDFLPRLRCRCKCGAVQARRDGFSVHKDFRAAGIPYYLYYLHKLV